jgi:hypothetical protein
MNVFSFVGRCLRLSALVLLAFGLTGTAESALQKAVSIVLSANPKEPTDTFEVLQLRPNAEQPVFAYVKNAGEEDQKLTVVAKGTDGSVLGQAEVLAKAGKATRVNFPKAEPPKAADAKPVDPKAPPADKKVEWVEQKGPPFKLQLELLDGKQQAIGKPAVVEMAIMGPSQYLEANAAWEAEKARIVVTTKLLPGFAGPPCLVELVLPPSRLPGVVPASLNDGTFREKLTKAGDTKKLLAEGIKFQGSQRAGEIWLNVDGFHRAFIYQADMSSTTGTTPFNLSRDNSVRAFGAFPKPTPDAPKGIALYTAPTDKYPLRLLVDTQQAGTYLVVSLDRNKDGVFDEDEKLKLPTSKQQIVWSNPEFPDGGFLFKTEVRDWVVNIDTEGLRGAAKLQVQLRDSADNELAKLDGQVIFDATPPDKIEFLPPVTKVIKGEKVLVKAKVSDPESPIVKGQLFFGTLKDGKLPPEAVLVDARPQGRDDDIWIADMPLPEGKKSLDLTAQFTNAAGLTATQSIKVEVVDPPPPLGTVKGIVKAGDLAQAGVEVLLKDEKEVKATTKTGPKGEFLFENVKPGPYNVLAQRKDAMTEGSAPVTVEASKTSEVALELVRKPKAK